MIGIKLCNFIMIIGYLIGGVLTLIGFIERDIAWIIAGAIYFVISELNYLSIKIMRGQEVEEK